MRGFCHGSLAELIDASQSFVARIDRKPIALVDRLWPEFDFDPVFGEKLGISNR